VFEEEEKTSSKYPSERSRGGDFDHFAIDLDLKLAILGTIDSDVQSLVVPFHSDTPDEISFIDRPTTANRSGARLFATGIEPTANESGFPIDPCASTTSERKVTCTPRELTSCLGQVGGLGDIVLLLHLGRWVRWKTGMACRMKTCA